MKNLNYCVSLVQMHADDYTTHRKQKYLQLAILMYRELKFRAHTNVEVAYITPNAVMNSPLPKNFGYWTKVGINYGGTILNLSVNQDLVIENRFDECGDEFSSALAGITSGEIAIDSLGERYEGGYYYAPHWRNGQFVGEMYGVGGGYNGLGYFKVNPELNLIQFSPEVPRTEIVLEYASDGSDVNGSTLIPTIAVNTIVDGIFWLLAKHDNKLSLAEKNDKWGNYNGEFQKYKELIFTPTIEEYTDAMYSTYKSTVKR